MNKLIFKSSNPDWNGTYTKAEVEAEMKELDQVAFGRDWIYWVLEHVFDDNELTFQIEKFIVTCDELKSITLKLKDRTVTVTKE